MSALSGASWTQISLGLIAATMAYNTIETVVAIGSGVAADSVTLIGFGLDSIIEFSAGAIVLRRIAAETRGSNQQLILLEHRAHRFVGGTFILIGIYVAFQAAWILWHAEAP